MHCSHAAELSNVVGPEHLELQVKEEDTQRLWKMLKHYGGLFVGERSAETMGDYGAGPNHVLPTSGTARYTGGLSVFTFLRVRTWMHMPRGGEGSSGEYKRMVEDAATLARLEGLEAHARAAEARLSKL